MTISEQHRSSRQPQRVKHIRAPQAAPSIALVRFLWHALFPDLSSAHGANTTTAHNRTIVFLYDHLNLPITTIAGLTSEQAAKYRHMFRIDRPVRCAARFCVLRVSSQDILPCVSLSQHIIPPDHDFAEYEIAKGLRRALLKKKSNHDFVLTDSLEKAELVIVALWEFGLCSTTAYRNVSKWEHLKGILAESTCEALGTFYRWLVASPRFRRHKGRDFVFLMDKVWFKRSLVPKEIITNSMLIGVEERRSQQARGASEAILVPYYLQASKWENQPGLRKDVLLAWVGTLSVDNHCDICSDLSPQLLRRRVLESFDCDSVHADCVVVTLAHKKRNDHSYLDKTVDMPKILKSSRFCPVPRGDSAATRRFYCAIFALCVPVLVSDHFPLAFQHSVNYDDFVIRLFETDMIQGKHDHLASFLLANYSNETLSRMQEAMLKAREQFSFNQRSGHAFRNLLRELQVRFERRRRCMFRPCTLNDLERGNHTISAGVSSPRRLLPR